MRLKFFFTVCILSLFLFSCSDKTSDTGEVEDLSLEGRINTLLSKMTIEEKIGQMTQVDINALQSINDVKTFYLGSLLAGGASEISDISASGWADYCNNVQTIALQTRLKIPLLFGIDAVHGHNNVSNAVIFPHNIGLGCTRNPELIKQASIITAKEIAGTGMNWTFAPCIAVPRDERWGRTYEGFGETPEIQVMASEAAVIGLQGTALSGESVLACAKHYVADGGTQGGDDQGDSRIDIQTLRNIHLPGYIAAINAGVGSVMASYNSWNGNKMHGHKYLLTDVLKNELKFDGFVVSDWAAVDQISGDYKQAVGIAINAGIDMVMVPNRYREFFAIMKELTAAGIIPQSRIDDAVKRILRVKFKMGLFEKASFINPGLAAQVGSQQHRDVARQCVRESLVLLKNEQSTLPLSKSISKIHVAGKSADNIGYQCGGWTITWQGSSGNITEGTSILQGIKNTVSSSTQVTYSLNGNNAAGADLGIVVIGETPYAEGSGDRSNLEISDEDVQAVNNMHAAGIPVVVILVSGRPLIIDKIIDKCDAFAAAWLPGTEGQGIADVLFGDYDFKGKLSHSWPRSMDQIPINYGDGNYDPLFPYGFGLSY